MLTEPLSIQLNAVRATRVYRRAGRLFHTAALLGAVLLCALGASTARASVAVLLEEPYGWFSHMSPTGHVAVYLDHVCAASPVQLRPCRPGELGVVISRYDGIDHRDWVAMPLEGYLYAVGAGDPIPVTVNRADVTRLRDIYRRKYLESVAPDLPDGRAPEGNWYELAGSAFDRTLYGFQVKSTPEQDAELIAYLNDHPNHEDYNGAFRNCADFTRVIVDRFYPHAIRRNLLADLGLTSPKAVARGMVHYANKHPEAELTTFRIAQISGDLPRSHPAVTLVEGLVKLYGVPLLLVSPVATGAVMAVYLERGRFSEPTHAPVLNLRTDISLPDAWNVHPRASADSALASAGAGTADPAADAHGGVSGAAFIATPQPVPVTWNGPNALKP